MKILVPTDFSQNAKQAIEYASLFARATNSELCLIHVYTPIVTHNNTGYALITEEIVLARKNANGLLTDTAREMSETYGISCTHLVLTGHLVEEITHYAREARMDLIIMGTKGVSNINKVLFGSNTAAVIEKASCEVIAVPETAKISLPKKIVFATDYLNTDELLLKELVQLAVILNAELTLLHVSKDQLKLERDIIEDFSKHIEKEIGHKQLAYYVMPHYEVEKGIELFVESSGADLLVLSTQKKTVWQRLFGHSVAKRMSYQSEIPLLVFHSKILEENKEYGF